MRRGACGDRGDRRAIDAQLRVDFMEGKRRRGRLIEVALRTLVVDTECADALR